MFYNCFATHFKITVIFAFLEEFIFVMSIWLQKNQIKVQD